MSWIEITRTSSIGVSTRKNNEEYPIGASRKIFLISQSIYETY